MKKTETFETFSTKVFIATLIGFMVLINLMFFIQGTFFTEGGYVFDMNKHVLQELPIAFLCGICAAFAKKREK